MTRRLEPLDRVKELGDASVPFEFDVHAMIYTEDAPSLERAFHQHFGEQRVNLLNQRKEFFDVSIDEIEAFVRARGMAIQITKLAEAREYRETVAIRSERAAPPPGAAIGSGPIAAVPSKQMSFAEGSGAAGPAGPAGRRPPASRRERAPAG